MLVYANHFLLLLPFEYFARQLILLILLSFQHLVNESGVPQFAMFFAMPFCSSTTHAYITVKAHFQSR